MGAPLAKKGRKKVQPFSPRRILAVIADAARPNTINVLLLLRCRLGLGSIMTRPAVVEMLAVGLGGLKRLAEMTGITGMLGFLGMKSCKGRKRFRAAPFLSVALATGNVAAFFLRGGVVTGKTVDTTV